MRNFAGNTAIRKFIYFFSKKGKALIYYKRLPDLSAKNITDATLQILQQKRFNFSYKSSTI